MKDGQISRTALAMAYVRSYHAANGDPKIFDDPLAHELLPEAARATIRERYTPSLEFLRSVDPAAAASCHDEASRLAWAMRASPSASHTLSRSRYAEDHLERAIARGARQYVILGAGMDTFAFRRPDLVERLRVFELDHPATQAFKRSRIAELGWKVSPNLNFVPVDFARESVPAALARAPYDPLELSFVSWLGVTYYLPREAVLATLRSFAGFAPSGSAIVLDYFDGDAFRPDKVALRMRYAMEVVRQMGEPLITGFDPPALSADLASLGLRLEEDLSPSDIDSLFFRGRTDGYYACEHVRFALALLERAAASPRGPSPT